MHKRWGFNRSVNTALVAALALGVAACASEPVTPPPCPEILIPVDGAKLTRFKPGLGRDIIDVMHEEMVTGFAHGCEYDTDSTGAGDLTVQILPTFESKRGPANPDARAQFEFFIAITDQEKNVLEKKRFPAVVDFPENMSRVLWQVDQPINLRIPLQAGKTGNDYRIFVGLQITPEERDYQRQNR